jgi:mono/diheme cytochrome c family protein
MSDDKHASPTPVVTPTPTPTPRARELDDPAEGAHPIPWVILILFVGLVLWGVTYFVLYGGTDFNVQGDQRDLVALDVKPASAGVANAANGANGAEGAQLFLANCAACHQATGLGLPGVFPPLVGSSWVKDNAAWPVNIILHGLVGEIEVAGKKYNNVMPAFKQLSDDDIAAIVTYIRQQFADNASAVDAARVKEIRSATANRTEPWQGGAKLLSIKN